ncbi:MAG: tetratricopeptide repeat protein [Thermoanaerobaculia bacterium]
MSRAGIFASVLAVAVCAWGTDAGAQRNRPQDVDAAYEFALAKVLAEEGRPRQALERMAVALRRLPDEPVLRVEYARLLLRVGQPARAIEEVDRARELAPGDRDVLAAVAEVHLAESAGSFRSMAAAQSALEALSRMPDPDPRAMISLAQLYLQQPEPGRAAEILRDLDERLPGNRFVTAMLAEALIRGGKTAEATDRLRGALERDPADLQSRLTLAQLQQEAGNMAAAAATLAGAPAGQREVEEVQRRLAYALVASGDVEAARDSLRKLVDEGAASRNEEFLYAEVISALGENAEAERLLRSLLSDESLRPGPAVELSRVLERLERGDEGAQILAETTAALRRDGETETAATLEMVRLELLARIEAWEEVVRALHGRLNEVPEDYRQQAALFLLVGLRESQRNEQALQLLRTGDLPLPSSIREVAEVETLESAGRVEEARELLAGLERAADPERQLQVGRLYLRWEEASRAIPPLERAASARPLGVEELYLLAVAYQEADRKADAERTLRQLLGVEADHADALNFLGYMLAEERRDLEEARRMTAKAVRQEPDNGAYVDSLGWACFQLGLLDEAQKYLERAARLLPGDATILEHLGDLYRQRGDHPAARRAYQRALEVEGEGEAENVAALERKLAALPQGL